MNISILVYLVSMIDGIKAAIDPFIIGGSIAFAICGLVALVAKICGMAGGDEEALKVHDAIIRTVFKKKYIAIFFALILLNVFVPGSKTICAMYLIPKIVTNDKVCNISNDALDVVSLKLQEWKKDMLNSDKAQPKGK